MDLREVRTVATGTLRSRPVAVALERYGRPRAHAWYLDDGAPIGPGWMPPDAEAVTLARDGDRTLAIVGTFHGELIVADLASGEQVREPYTFRDRISHVGLTRVAGVPVLVVDCHGIVFCRYLHDADRQRPWRQTTAPSIREDKALPNRDTAWATAIGDLAGRPFVACGNEDSPDSAGPDRPPPAHEQHRARAGAGDSAGVRLRPHAKTHKSPLVARWQIDAGAVGICCAKLGEAEVFADAGIADIRLPYPVHPVERGPRARADRSHAPVDHRGRSRVARGWSSAMTARGPPARRPRQGGCRLPSLRHRSGRAGRPLDMIRQVADLPGLRLAGLLSHAGHGYATRVGGRARSRRHAEIEILREARGAGAARRHRGRRDLRRRRRRRRASSARQVGVTEMRPGNYVFFDRTQVALGAATLEDCALHVISTS